MQPRCVRCHLQPPLRWSPEPGAGINILLHNQNVRSGSDLEVRASRTHFRSTPQGGREEVPAQVNLGPNFGLLHSGRKVPDRHGANAPAISRHWEPNYSFAKAALDRSLVGPIPTIFWHSPPLRQGCDRLEVESNCITDLEQIALLNRNPCA